jgi:prephenate dehydrogenase
MTLAGGGFESTVRLAKSSGETWAPIFLENSEYIIEVMDTYIEKMKLFRKMITEKNLEGLKKIMDEANAIRKILH